MIGQFIAPSRRAIEEMKKVNYCLSLFQNFFLENRFCCCFFLFIEDQSADQSIIKAQISVLQYFDFLGFSLQETYLMHTFSEDFYGSKLKVIMLGYIRPMEDFSSLGKFTDRQM